MTDHTDAAATTHGASTYAPVALAVAVLGMAGAFFGVMLQYTRGHLSPPLDDSLIYFQYARQIAHGKVFVYIDGDPATSGSTSFLYPFVLATGYLAGFRDDRLMLFGYALAIVALGAACWFSYQLARRLVGETAAWAAALLVAINGWVAWTFFSLMEAGLHTVAVLAALVLFTPSHHSRRGYAAFCAVVFLLPFVRPELSVLGFGIALAWTVAAYIERSEDAWLNRVIPPLAAIAGAVAYFAAVTALTGSPRTDTYLVQSILGSPYATWDAKASAVIDNFTSHLTFAFNFFAPSSLNAVPLVLAVAGAVTLVRDDVAERRLTVRSLIPAVAIAGILSASLEQRADSHFHRWAAPYEPLIVLLVVRGVVAVLSWVPRAPAFGWPAAVTMLAAALVPTIQAASQYGQNTSDIYYQQTAAANWLRETTPPDAVVGLNDAGAIPYYSRRRAYDIIGLVTDGNAEAFAAGPASVYERIENLPEEDRPTIYAIYPFGSGIYAAELGFLTPVRTFTLQRRTIAGSYSKIIYRPDNSLLGAGDDPGEIPGEASRWRVVDRLDVADIVSEDAHGYSQRQIELGVAPAQILLSRQYAGETRRIIDGGRTNQSERFSLRADPGRPFVVLMRTTAGGGAPIVVEGDGAVGRLELPATSGWRDIVVARGDAAGDRIELRVRSADAASTFSSFSYWLLQPQ